MVIPVYNVQDYIEETIRSVLVQDIGQDNFEIIAVDDGSTDNSLAILEQLSNRYPQLTVRSIPRSGSAARPRNVGIQEARGDYLFFLDADDFLEADTLRRAVRCAEETDVQIVLVKPGGLDRRVPHVMFGANQDSTDFIDSKAYRTLSVLKLFSRSLFEDPPLRFPEGIRRGEDETVALRAFLRAPRISILADKVYYWVRGRSDGTNITRQLPTASEGVERLRLYLEAIHDSKISGNRRELLLRRTMSGVQLLHWAFGPSFFQGLNDDERRRAYQMAQDLFIPQATDTTRSWGSAEQQVIFDVLTLDSLDSLIHASRELAQREPIFTYDDESKRVIYQSLSGQIFSNYNLVRNATVEQVSVSSAVLSLKLKFRVPLTLAAPDQVQIIWRHAASKKSVGFPTQHSVSETDSGIQVIVESTIPVTGLNRAGVWHCSVEAQWGRTKAKASVLASTEALQNPIHVPGPQPSTLFSDSGKNLSLLKDGSYRQVNVTNRLPHVQIKVDPGILGFHRRLQLTRVPREVENIRLLNLAPDGRQLTMKKVIRPDGSLSFRIPRWTQVAELLDKDNRILARHFL